LLEALVNFALSLDGVTSTGRAIVKEIA